MEYRIKNNIWKCIACCASIGEKLLNIIIIIMLALALLLGAYGIIDTIGIYKGATLSSDLKRYKPTDTGLDTPNPTLAELKAINPDVCAWLTVDDTNIDYPVVKGRSNLEYLNKSVYGKFSLSGSIFLDYYNSKDLSDRYILIYGHHMEGKVMFGELPLFLEDAYLESHPTGVIFTEENTYHIEWFACLETDAYDQNLFNPPNYYDDTSVEQLLEYVKTTATTYIDIGADSSKRYIAISTCTDSATDGRVVLIGMMI